MLRSFLENARRQRVLTSEAKQAALRSLQGWNLSEGESEITKTFQFDGFKPASFFLTRLNNWCTKTGQTPVWSNVYNTVNVRITTEEFNDLTSKDIELAKYLDTVHIASDLNAKLSLGYEESSLVQTSIEGILND